MNSTNGERVAVVTGAAQGIGRRITERLAEDGYALAVVDLEEKREGVEGLSEALNEKGRRSAALTCDVSRTDQVEGMARRVVEELGTLDVFVANAGIAQVHPLLNTTQEDFEKIMSVNLTGVFNSYRAAARTMIDLDKGGKIIGAASTVAYRPFEMLGGVLGVQVGGTRTDPGRGDGMGPVRHHGQRLLSGDRRNRHVGSHRRTHERGAGETPW